MEFLLIKGIKEGIEKERLNHGDEVTLNKIFEFMWPTLSNPEHQQFGKRFHQEVEDGMYSAYITFVGKVEIKLCIKYYKNIKMLKQIPLRFCYEHFLFK